MFGDPAADRSFALLLEDLAWQPKVERLTALGLTPREAEPGACVWVGADAGAARYVQWYNRQRRAQEQGEGEGAASALLSAGA